MANDDEFETWTEDSTGHTVDADAAIKVEVVNQVRVQEFPASSLTTGQVVFGLAGRVINIVPGRPSRVSVLVKNRGTAPARVWVGGNDQISAGTGYQLDPGEALGFEMNGPVYAVSDTDYAGGTASAPGRMDWSAINRDG